MTKTMRWGVGTLSLVGLVGFGTFVGCSSDNGGDQPPADTDTGVLPPVDSGVKPDTAPKPDTTTGETSGDTGGGETASETGSDTAEAPPPAPDRKVTFVFASPDTPPQFMCLAGFTGDPTAAGSKPAKALGPFGIPDPADPTKLKSGFGFGAVVPYPVTDKVVQVALDNPAFTIVAYFTDADPGTGGCGDAWATARTDPTKYFPVPKGKIVAGTSWMLTLTGCRSAATDASGTCPATPNFAFDFQQLDITDPTTFVGDDAGTKKAGLQFLHASNFPAFDNNDVYIQPMTAGADGGTGSPAGLPIKIADGSHFSDFSAPAVGVAPPGDPDSAMLLMVQHTTTPCGPPSATCLTTIPLPLGTFLAAYKAAGIPGVGWTGNQALVLAGSVNPTDPSKSKVIIAWVPSKF